MVKESSDKLNLTVSSRSNDQLTPSRKPRNKCQGKIETITNENGCYKHQLTTEIISIN